MKSTMDTGLKHLCKKNGWWDNSHRRRKRSQSVARFVILKRNAAPMRMHNYVDDGVSCNTQHVRPKILPRKPPKELLLDSAVHKVAVADEEYATPLPYSVNSRNGSAAQRSNYDIPSPSHENRIRRVLPLPPNNTLNNTNGSSCPEDDELYSEPESSQPCYDAPLGPSKPPLPNRPPPPRRQLSNENKYNPPYSVSTLNRKDKAMGFEHYDQERHHSNNPHIAVAGNSIFYDVADDDSMPSKPQHNKLVTQTNTDFEDDASQLYDLPDSMNNDNRASTETDIYYSEAVEPPIRNNGFQLQRMQNQVAASQGKTLKSLPNPKKYQTLPKPKPKRPLPFNSRIRAFSHIDELPETNDQDEVTQRSKHSSSSTHKLAFDLPSRPQLPLPNTSVDSSFPFPTSKKPSTREDNATDDIPKRGPEGRDFKSRFNKKFASIRPKGSPNKSNLSKEISASMPVLPQDIANDDRKTTDNTDGFKGKFHALLRPRKGGKIQNDNSIEKLKLNNRQSAPVTNDGINTFAVTADNVANIHSQFAARNLTKSNSPIMDRDLKKKLAFQKQRSEQQGPLQEEDTRKEKPKRENDISADMALFESVLVVSLKEENSRLVPMITFQFPPKANEIVDPSDRLQAIPSFCFPNLDSETSSHDLSVGYGKSETFSFVLTDMNGKRHFGYCRHIMEDSFGPSIKAMPKVFCIISSLGLFSLYSQVLDEVEKQQMNSPATVFSLLKTVLSQPLPAPGETLKMPFYSSGTHGMDTLTLERPGDSAIHAHVDLKILFDTLPVSTILSIITSLLMEKRIILSSSSLSTLSACCHGFISLLYPFVWQHTYIPVLPRKLIDICCSPTPYLLGVLNVCLPELEDLPMSEVTVVNLDDGKFIEQVSAIRSHLKGDSYNYFPKSIRDEMDKTLNTVNNESKKRDSIVYKEHKAKNTLITEVFVQAYIQMIGCFEDHIVVDENGSKIFQEESFRKATNSKEIKKFRKNFVATQAFLLFLEPWLDDESTVSGTGLFEQRLHEWKLSRKTDFHNFASRVRELLPKSKQSSQDGGGFHRFLGKLTNK